MMSGETAPFAISVRGRKRDFVEEGTDETTSMYQNYRPPVHAVDHF